MGRHRRSAAGTGGHDPQDSYTGDRATMGIAPYLNPEAYAETYEKAEAYLYATDDDYARSTGTVVFPENGYTPSAGSSPGHRRKKKVATPLRTGLLGMSAAVALGTVAVATGAVPGLDHYRLGGGTGAGGDKVQAAASAGNTASEQGGASAKATDGTAGGSSAGRDSHRSASPASPSASHSPSSPASSPASPSPSASASASPDPTKAPTSKAPSKKPRTKIPAQPRTTPSRTATRAPARTSAPVTVSAEAAAEAEVLKLVNEERAKVGCGALAANSSLTGLAESFSSDMAARDFFDHTDPDGATPWDRAAKAGITGLGGENIARGQADAAAVMEAWMNSPGHRANILNCDFKTLGVGIHYGSGGPWWTQDFGY
ncbi:CAP domain-containing protein [Streptomyces sp. NPDC004542]|uniref:CAP domain-containing protein n=1 Tax=Streptomyces sp. NPDC004542 TaxID=3154281 RepID=UPI0033A8C026